MKSCFGCAMAKWDRTASGRLHPSGDGRCQKVVKVPQLPAAFYWGSFDREPKACGGLINRKEELKDHCPYWSPVSGSVV